MRLLQAGRKLRSVVCTCLEEKEAEPLAAGTCAGGLISGQSWLLLPTLGTRTTPTWGRGCLPTSQKDVM